MFLRLKSAIKQIFLFSVFTIVFTGTYGDLSAQATMQLIPPGEEVMKNIEECVNEYNQNGVGGVGLERELINCSIERTVDVLKDDYPYVSVSMSIGVVDRSEFFENLEKEMLEKYTESGIVASLHSYNQQSILFQTGLDISVRFSDYPNSEENSLDSNMTHYFGRIYRFSIDRGFFRIYAFLLSATDGFIPHSTSLGMEEYSDN